jgi:hypothetical protein
MRTKRLLLILILLSLVAVGWGSCVYSIPCPFGDYNRSAWTGQTRIITGHVYGVYRCPLGHETLVPCD